MEEEAAPRFSLRSLGSINKPAKSNPCLRIITYDTEYLPYHRYELANPPGKCKYRRRMDDRYKRRKCHIRKGIKR